MMTEEQKEKHRERARQYYKKHREEILEYKKAYYAANRELCVDVAPLVVNLANAYDQKTVNAAFFSLFAHLDDGLLKKASGDCLVCEITEEEKTVLVHRIFYMSFLVNSMFLFNREERATLWRTR